MTRLLHALFGFLSMSGITTRSHCFDEGEPYVDERDGMTAWITPLLCPCGATDEMWTRIYELRGR